MFTNNNSHVSVRIMLVIAIFAGGLGVQPAQAASVDFGWARGIGGTARDIGNDIVVDSSGNVYTTGYFSDIVDFDPGIGTNSLTSAGDNDIFISKLDSSGEFVWAKRIGGVNKDYGISIAVDGSGNVFTTGFFSGTVDFDPGAGTSNLISAGAYDIFISKLDENGNFVWARRLGGTSYDMGNAITLDTNGNVYLTGSFSGTADFDPGAGTHNLTSSGDEDIFVCKLDGNGNFLWAKSMGGISTDWGTAVMVDDLGHVYTAGLFNETADFDPGAGTSTLTSVGGDDVFISKLDDDGIFVWAKAFGGNTGDHVSSIALDNDNNVHTTGSFSNTVDFDPGTGTHNLTSNGTEDVFVSKLDANGSFIWARNIGSTVAYSNGIQLDGGGNIYTTGAFYGVSDFDPGPGTQELTSVGFDDVFICKLDGSGNLIWAKSMGGANGDRGNGISVDANGNVHAVGYFAGTGDFDPGAGVSNLTSAGETDIFIVKLNAGSQIRYVKWNATGANDGSSWTNAYTDLQSALSAAVAGDEIWVAAGTYKPTSSADNLISFELKDEVAVYGGFAGSEMLVTQRNPAMHVTVLSGDINTIGEQYLRQK